MGAIKAVAIISGVGANAKDRPIEGLAVRTLRFDPAVFQVDEEATPTGSRVVVAAPTLEALPADVAALGARVTTLENAENLVAQPWAANVQPLYEAGQKSRALSDTLSLGDNIVIGVPTGDGLIVGHAYTLIVFSSTGWLADFSPDWKGDVPAGLTGAANEAMAVLFVWLGYPLVVASFSGSVA